MKFARSGIALLALVAVACSSTKGSGFGSDGNGNGTGSDGTGNGTSPGGFNPTGDGGAGSAPGVCDPNPANYDVPGDGCDNDGDGTVDNVATCDGSLSATGSANDFVQALGVCQMADSTHWGLVSATYTNGYGSSSAPDAGQHSIRPGFGTNVKPREGSSLGVISTGYATEYDDSGNTKGSKSSITNGMFKQNSASIGNGTKLPSGFPKSSGSCHPASDAHDVIDVKIVLQAPANAQGIAIDFDFYSGEWPEFVCSTFNDGFIAYLSSPGFNGGAPDNISFDSSNNPITVNNGFFDRCTPGADLGCSNGSSKGTSVCTGGTDELQGTGFYDFTGDYGSCGGGVSTTSSGGATGWLTSQAPIKGGDQVTIEFLVWNTGDESYDSSVLLDHLTWVPGPVATGTTRPPR